MTYSMCCQRPTMPRRLPTLTLPATAPTAGSANGCTSRRIESGSKTVSPSTITIRSWRASATPVLSAFGLPPSGTRTTRTLPQAERARPCRPVPSVEPSSTTITSTPRWSPTASDRTAAPMPLAARCTRARSPTPARSPARPRTRSARAAAGRAGTASTNSSSGTGRAVSTPTSDAAAPSSTPQRARRRSGPPTTSAAPRQTGRRRPLGRVHRRRARRRPSSPRRPW